MLEPFLADTNIEWIKGLLAVPFVLYSQPTGVFEPNGISVAQMSEEAHRRYAEIMRDVEVMIDDHSAYFPFPSLSTAQQLTCQQSHIKHTCRQSRPN